MVEYKTWRSAAPPEFVHRKRRTFVCDYCLEAKNRHLSILRVLSTCNSSITLDSTASVSQMRDKPAELQDISKSTSLEDSPDEDDEDSGSDSDDSSTDAQGKVWNVFCAESVRGSNGLLKRGNPVSKRERPKRRKRGQKKRFCTYHSRDEVAK
eukprot:TRINITY_DN2176_c0_g1_i12.p1 TRINITY_DN2176_c0_g1~~TRINITY_DN2176_c0_g1_i12.p1  ORF type:complete len:153 (-),score=4.45 TRINITY_DN2176_c0_g1_i12:129-587(-)